MATINRIWHLFASKAPTFNGQQNGFAKIVCADLSVSKLTHAQILKQFRQEYIPVDFFQDIKAEEVWATAAQHNVAQASKGPSHLSLFHTSEEMNHLPWNCHSTRQTCHVYHSAATT